MSTESETRAEVSPADSDFPLTPAIASEQYIDSSIHQRMSSQRSECSTSSQGLPLDSCKSLIEVMRDGDNTIDLEEEERIWSSFDCDSVWHYLPFKLIIDSYTHSFSCQSKTAVSRPFITALPSASSVRSAPPSVFSNDIWIESTPEDSNVFARGVRINGWTRVGDKKQGGAYVG